MMLLAMSLSGGGAVIDGRLVGTGAGAAIAAAMITAAMGTDVDFEDIAIGGAGDFLKRFTATGTGLLVVGQHAVFVRGRQMIVIASAMPGAALLLSTLFAVCCCCSKRWNSDFLEACSRRKFRIYVRTDDVSIREFLLGGNELVPSDRLHAGPLADAGLAKS